MFKMNKIKRIFGSGPICLTVGVMLIFLVYHIELFLKIPKIPISDFLSNTIFIISIILTLIIVIWGFLSLPFKKRGKELVTDGAFRYFRHPLYAGLLDFLFLDWGFI